MRRRLLIFLGIFTFRHAWLVLPLVVALSTAAWWQVDRGEFDTSLIDFIPPDSKMNDRTIREIVNDYRRLEPVTVVIRHREAGREAELRMAARSMAQRLNDPRYFMQTVYRVDELAQNYYQSLSDLRLVMLMTDEDWDRLRLAMREQISTERLKLLKAWRLNAVLPRSFAAMPLDDPLGALDLIRERLANSRGPTRLTPRDGYFMSADGKAILLLAYPANSAEDGRNATRTERFLDRTRRDLLDAWPAWRDQMSIEYAGAHVTVARHIEQMQGELGLIAKLSVPLALMLILLVFRKVEALLFILLPPGLGLLWSQAATQWAFGGVSVLTFCFLIIIAAIGLQYTIHLYHRFTIELYHTRHYYRALRRAYVETGRGLMASALVVALIFLLLLVTSLWGVADWRVALEAVRESRGLAQLGVVSAVGILCHLAACMLVVPLLAAVKHLLARGRVKPVALYRFGLERLYEPAILNPRATVGVMLLVCVFFGWHARGIDFNPRFASVSAFFFRTEPPDAADAPFPRPGRPIVAVVEGETLQAALENNDRLYRNLQIIWRNGGEANWNLLAFDSLRTVLPSLRSQQAALDQLDQLDLAPLRETIERATREAGLKPLVYEPFLEVLENFRQQSRRPRYIEFSIDESDELIANVQRYVTGKGGKYYIATAIYPHAEGFNPQVVTALTSLLSVGIDSVKFIGDPLIERDLSQMIRFNLALMVLLSFAGILGALLLHFRRWRMTLLTFLPILAAIVWFGGMMSLAGLRLHFFTVLAMPLVLSLAMDNALQLSQFHHDRRPCSVRQTMLSVGRVSMLTCAMMAMIFGTLALAGYPGLREFGLAVLFGAAAVLMASVMLLPALLQLFGRDQTLSEALTVEVEEKIFS